MTRLSFQSSVQAKAARPSGFYRQVFCLLRPFWPIMLFSTVMGTIGGLATAWLLATINASLHAGTGVTLHLLGGFAILCLLSVGGTVISGVGNTAIGQRVIAALRKDISARILGAPIAAIEQQRSYRLMAVLTSDVDTVSAFTFNFAGYTVAVAIVLGSIAYLLLLSPPVFVVVLIATFLGIGLNIKARRGWIKDYEGVRSATDELQKQYRVLTDGAKELRLSRERRLRVHSVLLSGAVDRIASLKTRAMRAFWIADAAGSAIFFAVIGLMLAARDALGLDASVISGTVLVLLYVKGPVEQIASGLPMLGQAQISFRRIAALSADFAEHEAGSDAQAGTPLRFGRSIELRDLRYVFSSGFEVGPINLTLRRGETLFIVGENGSGKTTLIKLLLGLYAPTSGRILLDGAAVAPECLDDYRQLFSAVFADYFLFEDLVETDPATVVQANAYLQQLELAHKVQIKNATFSTIDLSAGQRKRLALVHAYLEQRPVMMFDEWAADQDPTFRRVFYTELLPDLKRQGKTLIVISHDDRYFDVADRVVHLKAGRILEESRPSVQPAVLTQDTP